MNFEKLFLKYKYNILMFFLIFLVIVFITIPNKVQFLYGTPLGRAYLIALLIIVTKYNRYLGLISVIIIAMIYNNTDTITENFVEGAENKDDDEDKEKNSSILGALSEKLKSDEDEDEDEDKEEFRIRRGKMVTIEEGMHPKSSKSLPSFGNFSVKREPSANWSGKEGLQGLGFAPV